MRSEMTNDAYKLASQAHNLTNLMNQRLASLEVVVKELEKRIESMELKYKAAQSSIENIIQNLQIGFHL